MKGRSRKRRDVMHIKIKHYAAAVVFTLLLAESAGCGKEVTMVSLEEKESTQAVQETAVAEETKEAPSFTEELTETEYFVYVCGAVEREGVYRLPAKSRIFEAVEMAGGFGEEASKEYINLAQEIADGMKIYIPTAEEVLQAGNQLEVTAGMAGEGDTQEADSGLVNINTAGKEQLTTLPGIGASRAESIITYRDQQGKFQKIEDIMKVSGIKEGAFAKIKDRICVN